MKFTFACKKISLNDSIKEYAEKKISKLDKYFPEEADAFVTFAVEKKNRCVVELTIRSANGTLFRAQTEDPDGDMRGAIDEAVSFIDRRIRKNTRALEVLYKSKRRASPKYRFRQTWMGTSVNTS